MNKTEIQTTERPQRRVRTQAQKDDALRAHAREDISRSGFDPTHPAYTFAIAFLDSQRNPMTARGQAVQISRWFHYCVEHHLDPFAAKRIDAKSYIAAQPTDIAPATIHQRISCTRSWYEEAIEEELTVRDPFRGLHAGNLDPVTPTPSLSFDEVDRIIEVLNARLDASASIVDLRDAAMFYFMARLGPRRIEVERLRWKHLAVVAGMPVLTYHLKGDRFAQSSLPVDVVDGLEDWHHDLATATGREVRPDDAVFPALGHKGCFLKGSAKASPLLALGRETISVVCKHLMADAGISGARYAAHAMRATAATLAYLGSQGHGASMDDIQAMLHHSKQETTRRYIKLTEHRASAAVVWIPSTKLKRADSAAGTQKDAA